MRNLEPGVVGQMDQSVRRLFLSSRPETTAEVLQWKRDSGGNTENAHFKVQVEGSGLLNPSGVEVLLKSKVGVTHPLKRKDKHSQTCELKEVYFT